MKRFSDDDCLEILNSYWDSQEARVNTAGILELLGEDGGGDLFAAVVVSNLRGWQPLVARELREIVIRHQNPPTSWLENLWNYAEASITSDPDEMTHLFTVIRYARSDSVRLFFAQPFVRLSERKSDFYQLLGFEGLECLITCGGAVHLARFVPRIAAIARTTQNPVIRRSVERIIQRLPAVVPEPVSAKPWRNLENISMVKSVESPWSFNQRSATNDYFSGLNDLSIDISRSPRWNLKH